MIRGHRRAPDTANSRADLDLLGEVIRAWSGLRPRCDPFRKRQRCVVLKEGISGERHLHANVARVRTAVRAQEAGCEPAGPVSTGKTTTRNRSTRPASRSDRHRVRLPRVRIGLVPSCFIAATAWTASPLISRVLGHDNGGCNAEENTIFDVLASSAMAAPSSVMGSSEANALDSVANPDIRR